jgi:phosphate transport system substrate-binding protein
MKSGKNDLPALLLTLLITLGLLGGGAWFIGQKIFGSRTNPDGQLAQTPAQPGAAANLSLDTSRPNPTVLTIDGSVTLVALVKQLQNAFLQVNPNLPTTYGVPDGTPSGTNQGIQNLANGQVLLAVSSRPLKPQELQLGLQAVPIARDALAIAVGVDNPYQGGLTLDQLKQIFQGKITNWSQVGGPNSPIRVINRSPNSGTYTFFQDVVLLGEAFAPNGGNVTTAERDETTPLLQALGRDGITYSTVTQTVNQKTVRTVPINGISPTDQPAVKAGTYPISRVTYLIAPQQTSPAVKQFIELTLSPTGQQIVQRIGFIPIQ